MADHNGPLGGAPPRPAPSQNDFEIGPGQGAQFSEFLPDDHVNSNQDDRVRNVVNIPEQASMQGLVLGLDIPGQSGIQGSNVPEQVSTQANNIPEQLITFSEEDNTFFSSVFGDNDEFNLPRVDHEQIEPAIVIECSSRTMPFDGTSDPRLSTPADQGCSTPEQEAIACNMQHGSHAHDAGNQHEQHNQQSNIHGLEQYNVLNHAQRYGEAQEDSYDPQQQQQNFAPQQQRFYQSQQQTEVHRPQRKETRHPQTPPQPHEVCQSQHQNIQQPMNLDVRRVKQQHSVVSKPRNIPRSQPQNAPQNQSQHSNAHRLKPQVFRHPPQGADPSRKQATQQEVQQQDSQNSQHQYVLQTLRQQLAYHEQLEAEHAKKAMFHLEQHFRIRKHLALKEQQALDDHNDNEDVPIDLLNTNFPKIGSPASLQAGVNTIGSSSSTLPIVFTGNSVDGAPTSRQATNATNYQANHVDTPQYIPNPSLPAQRSEHPEMCHNMQPKRTADMYIDGQVAEIPDPKRIKTRGIFHGNNAQAHLPEANEALIHNPQPQYPPVFPSSLIDGHTQMSTTLPPSLIDDNDGISIPLPPSHIGVLAANSAITVATPVITSGDTTGTAPNTKYKLKYKSADESRNARALRHMDHDWIPPQNDATIPRNDYERGGYIRQLVDAYTDITMCTDNQTSAGFKKRWAGLTTGDSIYTGQMIEIVCWKLLSIAEELHTVGPKSLRVSDMGKLKNIEKFKDTLFNERIDDICALLRASKWRCDRLMKFMEMNMVVAAPKLLLRNSVQNKPQNARRQKRLEVGRALHKQKAEGLAKANEEGLMNVAQSNEAQNGGQFGNGGTNVQPACETNNYVEEMAQNSSQNPPTACNANLNHVQLTDNNNPTAFQDQHQPQPTQDSGYPAYEPANSIQGQDYAQQPPLDSTYPGYEPAQSIHGQGHVQSELGVPKTYEPHSQIPVATSEARATHKRGQSVLEDSNVPGEHSGPPSPKRRRMEDQSGEL